MTCVVCGDPINKTFYTTVDHKGSLDTYCGPCYSKTVVDNYPGMKATGTNIGGNKCECGKDKHGFASHSSWCEMKDSA